MFHIASVLIIVAALQLAASAEGQPGTAENLIHVEITGLRNDKGQVQCALFTSPVAFPKHPDKAVARTYSNISQGRAVCEFPKVAAGTYAISVFHDENGNGKMDTNFIGMPREGVGASNNALGHFGPPKFEAAAFNFAAGRMDLEIKITYLSGGGK